MKQKPKLFSPEYIEQKVIPPVRPAPTTKVEGDLLPLLDKLVAVFDDEPNLVRQQQAIELLALRHALRMGNHRGAMTVAAGIYKHLCQMIEYRFKGKDDVQAL